MEIANSLETAAYAALENIQEGQQEPFPIDGLPFYLSTTGEGLIIHGKIDKNGVDYYIGTLDSAS